MQIYHFWPKNDGEKWSRKNISEIPSCAKPFSENLFYFIERRSFGNKNDMVNAWRNFRNIFSRPLFTIIFRPEMLKFHP